jgi:hypothetical protein
MTRSSEGRTREKKPSRREISIKARVHAVAIVMGDVAAKKWQKLRERGEWYRRHHARGEGGNGFGVGKRRGMKLVKKMLKYQGVASWNPNAKTRRKLRKRCAA